MKRKRHSHATLRLRKRAKIEPVREAPVLPDQAVLRHFYSSVQSLREHLAAKVSKKRRKPVQAYGRFQDTTDSETSSDIDLANLLDTVLVCKLQDKQTEDASIELIDERDQSTLSAASSPHQPLSDVLDFCITLLFKRHANVQNPPHVLCHGFSRLSVGGDRGLQLSAGCRIPGLAIHDPNPYVERLSSSPWTLLPPLLGRRADEILADLFLHYGLFGLLQPQCKNWIQLSGNVDGVPLSELSSLKPKPTDSTKNPSEIFSPLNKVQFRSSNTIRFVRQRLLYGTPVLNASGRVSPGHRPVHVLNRYEDIENDIETLHIMKHVFPKQFGLHNVFTSTTTREDNGQPFLDYTMREDEIKRQDQAKSDRRHEPRDQTGLGLPKRLRGLPFQLVKGTRKRHSSCAYSALMNHYCPLSPGAATGTTDGSMGALATPAAHVSAFCRTVIRRVFPAHWWDGSQGPARAPNESRILQAVDQFIHLGRYESMTLHNVLEGVRLSTPAWLVPPNTGNTNKICMSDMSKRKEMFSELLYYLFDSFLIPLISANFYVTDSSVHRNQLLFFRHDVWLNLSNPTLSNLRANMFEEIKPSALKRMQLRRQLGVSRIRLMPKERGLRPIINLRRRVMTKINGRTVLGYSINTSMKPAFSVLNFLKNAQPALLGCSIFSADEIFPRLQRFRQHLSNTGRFQQPLYFVKLDVQACFDTIPQKQLMQLLEDIVSSGEYSIGRYSEAKYLSTSSYSVAPKVSWKYRTEAQPAGIDASLSQMMNNHYMDQEGRVLVDKVSRKYETRSRIMDILKEHIERNLVQIGKRMYRQKIGIPQGSVVSSLLCSFFYGLLDRSELEFLRDDHCLLTRLIDDFLLITPHAHLAERFINVMHAGLADFGVTIKTEKSKTNFPASAAGQQIGHLPQATDFPYCGLTINTTTLNVSADLSRRRLQNIRSSVTVEHSKTPGQSFYRKAMDMVKLHMHGFLLSTNYNSTETVTKNLHHAFTDIAWRCVHYINGLSTDRRPGARLIIKTIEDVIGFAFGMMRRRRHSRGEVAPYECAISWGQTHKIAYEAVLAVFERRQTRLRVVVEWLRARLAQPDMR